MAEIGSIGEPLLRGDGSSRHLEQHQIGRLGNGKDAHLHARDATAHDEERVNLERRLGGLPSGAVGSGRRTCRLIMRCLASGVLPAMSCQRCLAGRAPA